MRFRLAHAVAVAWVLGPGLPNAAILAQHDRYAPLVLQLPASARATGFGGAFVAVRDAESVFSNPALAGTGTSTAGSVERFRASSQGTIASSISLGSFGVTVGAQYLRFSVPIFFAGGLPVTPGPPVPSNVLSGHGESGGSAAASSLSAALGLSTTFKGLRWGAAAKYVEEQLGNWHDGSAVADIGVAKEGGTFTLGLSVQNLGPDITYVPNQTAHLPLRATLGAAAFGITRGPFDVGVSLALSVLRDGFVSPAGGMEWGYSPLEGYNFVVRAGARRPELREQKPLALGGSFTLDRFTLDYAFEDLRGGTGHRIGVRVR